MYRANWLLAIFILLVGIPLAPAAADDASVCAAVTGDEAITACSRVIESGQTRGRALAVIYRHRGIALRIKGENDRSIADLDAAIRLNPKFVSALANRGIVWRNKGDLDRSIADLDAAIQLDPKNAFAFFHRAFTWGVKGERDRAIADYSEAIRLNPKDAVAFNNRGNLWKDKRDLDRAFADYNEAIRLNPKYSMAYNNRGLAWNAKRDLDRAISDYDEAIRLDPKYAPAYNNRGIAWKDKGQLDRAISDYDVAIRLDPKNALARSNRGSSWRTKRDFDRAITDYNEAIRLDPNYSAAITGRGLAYESKGERDRARANFEMALAVPPKYDSGKWAQDTARTRLALLPPAKTPSVAAPGPSPSISADRIALVIGNGAYANAPHLPNPPNDARAVAQALRGIGFTVIDGTDLDHNGMERSIVDFLRKAALARIAVVFYAGHGVQIDGKNYLMPIDAKSIARSTVTFELIDVDRILASLDDEARANIIILDACRDNPLESRLASRSGARGTGLAGYSTVASGMLIAFATAPGMTAADGTGQNSPFTTALIKHIGAPGLEINQMLNRVRKDVVDATSRQQIPWTNSSLLGDVVLSAGEPNAASRR